jgi:hypothetical protein
VSIPVDDMSQGEWEDKPKEIAKRVAAVLDGCEPADVVIALLGLVSSIVKYAGYSTTDAVNILLELERGRDRSDDRLA